MQAAGTEPLEAEAEAAFCKRAHLIEKARAAEKAGDRKAARKAQAHMDRQVCAGAAGGVGPRVRSALLGAATRDWLGFRDGIGWCLTQAGSIGLQQERWFRMLPGSASK